MSGRSCAPRRPGDGKARSSGDRSRVWRAGSVFGALALGTAVSAKAQISGMLSLDEALVVGVRVYF